jgi:hypothetical protein
MSGSTTSSSSTVCKVLYLKNKDPVHVFIFVLSFFIKKYVPHEFGAEINMP